MLNRYACLAHSSTTLLIEHQLHIMSSYQQIHAACQGFPDSGIVGRGGFGPVFRGRFEGEAVAVKRLDGFGLQGLPNFWKEVTVST